MIVDTSAVLAILLGEPEADAFALKIAHAAHPRLSAVAYLEAAIRIDRLRSPVASAALEELLARLRITIEPVTAEQAYLAGGPIRPVARDYTRPARTWVTALSMP